MAKSKSIRGMLLGAAITISTVCAPSLANAAEVYFIRGAFNVFSAGMNQMTSKLRARGVNAKAMSNGQWSGVAADIIRRSKVGKVSYPIVIAGHSVGGQEAPRFSDALSKAGVKVALVIGIDPGFARPPPFTAGSPRVVNYWIKGSSRGNPYRSSGNFRGSIRNIDIRSFTNADHVQIDKDPKVQSRIIGLVMSAL